MVSRILPLMLLLGLSSEAAAQPQLPTRGAPLPAVASPAATQQIDPADRQGVLIAAAGYLRDVHLGTGDSIFLDPRYHEARIPQARDLNLPYGPIAAEELRLLQRELRAETANWESVERNCRGGYGCELTVPQLIVLTPPVVRSDGTVTMVVLHEFRSSSTPQPTTTSTFELVMARTGTTWTVTAAHALLIS